jgi:hypothetical protein
MVWLGEVGSKAMWLIRGTEDVENIMCIFIINKINNKQKRLKLVCVDMCVISTK